MLGSGERVVFCLCTGVETMKHAELVLARRLLDAVLPWIAVVTITGCATSGIEVQWKDPQAAAGAMQGKSVLVVCRGLDLTLERICEDQLAVDVQALGVKVVRAEGIRDLPADAAAASEPLLKAARAVQADAVIAAMLERSPGPAAGGGTVGIGVGGASGGWGSRTGGSIGITLPIGSPGGPGLVASTRLLEAGGSRLLWSSRTRASDGRTEGEQVVELTRVIAGALQATGLF
jgi:hypothetical protein